MTLPLRHPFTALVAGPTGCGKTRFVFKLIEHARVIVDPPPRREYQQLFSKYPRVTFHKGLPNLDDLDGREPTLLEIDEQITVRLPRRVFICFHGERGLVGGTSDAPNWRTGSRP